MMIALFGVLSMVGFVVCFAIMVINALRKKKVKPYAIATGVFFVVLIVCLAIDDGPAPVEETASNNEEAVVAEVAEVAEKEEATEAPQADEAQAEEADADAFTFTIVPEEKGEYGFENTLNAGTEFEETQIVYHIPAGTYKVTNLGEFQGQIGASSDETHKTEEGWEEPASTGDQVVVKPNETAEFTIEDGYYLEVHVNGSLKFVKAE